MADVVVIGLGNVLVGDDAFGPFVVRTMAAAYAMADGVEICDLGTPGLDLGPHLAGTSAVVIVDSVKLHAPPGTLHCYRKADLVARGPTPRTNPHQPSLVDTLLFLELQELAPAAVLLIGAVPRRYDTGAPLSAPLRAAVPRAIELVVEELGRLGRAPTRRAVPDAPDIWWEADAGSRSADELCGAAAGPSRTREE